MSTLDSIAEAIVDCEHKTAPEGDGYALSVGTRAMKEGRILLDACKRVSEDTYEKWTRRMRPIEGDLILAREAPVGQVVRVPEQPLVCLGQRTVMIRPDPSAVHPRFLHYWLLGPDAQQSMNSVAAGATVPHLNVADIRSLDVSRMPRDPSQQAVAADALGAIDDLIENNRRRVEVLEEMARAIYREWFVRFRYPGHEDVPLVDSPLGPIPDQWTVLPASEVLEINPRVPLTRGTRCRHFTMGDLDERVMNCQPSGWKDSPTGSKFVNGDTLFARITPCLENGKTGFVQALGNGEAACGSTEFVVLRGRLVGPSFTYLLARQDDFRGHAIASMSGASGRQRVRSECFDSLLVPTPPEEIAVAFEAVVTPLFRQSWALHRQAATLASLRDVLMPKLVTGEIDVSHLDLDSLTEAAPA